MEERTNEIMEQNNDVIEVIGDDNEKASAGDVIIAGAVIGLAAYGCYKAIQWIRNKVSTATNSHRKNDDDAVEAEPEKVVEISEKKSGKEAK